MADEEQFAEYPGSLLACERAVIRRDLRVSAINPTDPSIGVNILLGALCIAEKLLPAIAAGPLNDYAPADVGSVTILSFNLTGGPGVVSITGLDLGPPSASNCRVIVLSNRLTSNKSLSIEHQNAGSNPTNRFVNGSTGGARVLGPGGSAMYSYNIGGSGRWVLLSAPSL
jgi:hypothetical protein